MKTTYLLFYSLLVLCVISTTIIVVLNQQNTKLRNIIETQNNIINSNVNSQKQLDSTFLETIKLNIELLNTIDSINNSKNKKNEKI